MAFTEPGLAVTIRAISPRGMWGFIRDMGGGAQDIMVAGFMGRGVSGAFDPWMTFRARDIRAFLDNGDARFLSAGWEFRGGKKNTKNWDLQRRHGGRNKVAAAGLVVCYRLVARQLQGSYG